MIPTFIATKHFTSVRFKIKTNRCAHANVL